MPSIHATALAALLLLPAPAPAFAAQASDKGASLDDATIVAIFDLANTADIETGRLATERGHSPKVRALGRNFAEAHTQVRQLGRDLAKRLGVTPTPPADQRMAEQHRAAMQHLEALNGEAFDRAYLQREAEFHAAVIAAVTETLLPAIRNDELRSLLEKVAPAFQSHLAAVKERQKELGY